MRGGVFLGIGERDERGGRGGGGRKGKGGEGEVKNHISEEEHRRCCGAYNIESGTEVLLARLKSLVRGI